MGSQVGRFAEEAEEIIELAAVAMDGFTVFHQDITIAAQIVGVFDELLIDPFPQVVDAPVFPVEIYDREGEPAPEMAEILEDPFSHDGIDGQFGIPTGPDDQAPEGGRFAAKEIVVDLVAGPITVEVEPQPLLVQSAAPPTMDTQPDRFGYDRYIAPGVEFPEGRSFPLRPVLQAVFVLTPDVDAGRRVPEVSRVGADVNDRYGVGGGFEGVNRLRPGFDVCRVAGTVDEVDDLHLCLVPDKGVAENPVGDPDQGRVRDRRLHRSIGGEGHDDATLGKSGFGRIDVGDHPVGI